MSTITLPTLRLAHAALGRQNLQSPLTTTAGVSQITSFPSRLWELSFATIPFHRDEDAFREWSLAIDQLSDLANCFHFSPPDYQGPSTGYAGATPLVMGGSQLGTSLICDGVSNSVPIVKAGDFASFTVTSPGGNSNRQLLKIAADASSNGSGQVTLAFTKPIRQAPADNATVQIFTPTAQFRLTQSRYVVASDSDDFASFSVEAIEQVYP
jgi:hypothetical protein